MARKLLLLFLPLILLAGCAPASEAKPQAAKPDNTVIVRYDPTKYGDEWLKQAAKQYESEHSGVKIRLTADAKILQSMTSSFRRGKDLPDVAVMPSTNWQEYAEKGWLDDLTPLYSEKAGGQTIAERIVPGLRSFGSLNGRDYVLPLADDVCGILYNEKLFDENGWAVPQNASDFFPLMQQIIDKDIAPFSWPGKDSSCWDGIVNSWWAQWEGSGAIASFLEMKSPDVYRQGGRLQALSLFESIITDPQNSVSHPEMLDDASAFAEFAQGKAAMIPGSVYMISKYRSLMPNGFRVGIMKVPAPEGAKEPNLYAADSGNFICIPSNARHRSEAESFVKFLTSGEVQSLFYKSTGVPCAFGGIPSGSVAVSSYSSPSAASAASAVLSASGSSSASVSSEPAENSGDQFTQEVYELYTNSQKVYFISKKACYYSHFLNWPGSGSPFLPIFMQTTTAHEVFDSDADYAAQNWKNANAVSTGSSSISS